MSLQSPPDETAHLVPESELPYRDGPFVITIDQDQDISQPPPPSYEELCVEDRNTRALQRIIEEFDIDAAPVGEICTFIVAMMLIALTVAGIGAAFHWGTFGCQGPNC